MPRPAHHTYLADPRARLTTAQVAKLYGCTLSNARRIGAQHGGAPVQAVDPTTGKLTNYYPAEPLLEHHAATYRARRLTSAPAGYTTAAQLATAHGITHGQLTRARRHCPIRTLAGYSPAKRPCTYYSLADIRSAISLGYLRTH